MINGNWVQQSLVRDYVGALYAIETGGQRIEATEEHPFWVVKGVQLETRPVPRPVAAHEHWVKGTGRWVEAKDLRAGDVLRSRNGQELAIKRISTREARLKVYNAIVEGLHTYAVGENGILVHNNNCGLRTSSKWDTSIARDGATERSIGTDVTADEFISNLQRSGYDIIEQGLTKNGTFTKLSNGSKLYTVYPATSGGMAAQFNNALGVAIKLRLGR